jgi:hypothetical protein
MQYFATTHKETVTGYPYGRLTCTKFYSLEFKKGKGFRTVEQTICPKTGRLNAPKYSTYDPITVMFRDAETGYIRYRSFRFYSIEDHNKICNFMQENVNLFTDAERSEIWANLVVSVKLQANSYIKWCGAKADDVLPLVKGKYEAAVKGFKNNDLTGFDACLLDLASFEATKVEGFNPFTIKEYQMA